jgi:hypothetical protein
MYRQILNKQLITRAYKKNIINICLIHDYIKKDVKTLIDTKKFKEKYPNYKAIEIIVINENFFKNDTYCKNGEEKGLYATFTNECELYNFTNYSPNSILIAHIELLNGGKIWKEKNKYITNKFEITKHETIDDYINNLPTNKQLEAVKHNGCIIEYITNPSKRIQLEAVRQNGFAIRNIKNPSEKVQLEAIKIHESVIEFINNPSKLIQLKAIRQNGLVIKYIKNPSEQMQLEAVKQNKNAIYHIKNPSEKVKLEVVKKKWIFN